MTELLPIVFQRGQNESIDPRVAPAEVHAVAQNVRWRKDGRPAKRYGSTPVSMTGYEQSSSYLTQPANAVCSWMSCPLFVCGSGAGMLNGTQWGQRAAGTVRAVDLAHWGPGARNTIAQPEAYVLNSLSAGNGGSVVLFAWDDGTNLYFSARSRDGATLVQPFLVSTGIRPRVIPLTTNSGRYIYVLFSNGASLVLATFDTQALTTAFQTLDTLGSAGYYFDGVSRGADFVIAYQLTATTARVRTYTAGATATLVQSQVFAISSSVAAKIGVAGTSTSNIFVGATQDVASGGRVTVTQYNNALGAVVLAPTVVDTDIKNLDPPGFAIASSSTAYMTWGGGSTAPTAYLRWGLINAAGLSGTVVSNYGLRPASKPFLGPAASTFGTTDSQYVWAHTAQTTDNVTWVDQKGYVLVDFGFGVAAPRRHMHVPNIVVSTGPSQDHLADVFNGGTGYGYNIALVSTIRLSPTSTSGGETYGAEWVTFRSIFESQRQAARDFATCGRVVQFSGGSLSEWSGSVEETGFTNFPVILNAIAGAGGSLSAGNYLYRVVYEWLDAQGRRHRSAPSDPVAMTAAAGQRGTITYQVLVAESRLTAGGVTAHVYRTLAGQGTYHRVTPNTGAPIASPSLSGISVSYADLMSDSEAKFTEILYTDGGVVPNTLPPPSTFMCVCNGRLWLGGQLDRNVITSSKILVDGEPTQFSDELEFSVFLPTECTGLASIDGTVVAFGRERIYFVTGDGPNDQGIGSFNPPTELPTDVGCIDWRSIIECSQGVFFQSKRGIFLLPRGFNTPLFVGADVESTLATYPIVQSATLVSQPSGTGSAFLGEITARFIVASDESGTLTRTLVYDLRTGGWSVDTGTALGIGGTWSDLFVYTTQTAGVFVGLNNEQIGSYGPGFISTQLGTGDIRPFGIAGYGGFVSVVLVGEYRGDSVVTVSVSVDGQAADSYLFPVLSTDADIGTDGSVYLDVTPKIRMGSAIRVTVSDGSYLGGATEGFVMQALFIEHETIGKTKRLAAARRA